MRLLRERVCGEEKTGPGTGDLRIPASRKWTKEEKPATKDREGVARNEAKGGGRLGEILIRAGAWGRRHGEWTEEGTEGRI